MPQTEVLPGLINLWVSKCPCQAHVNMSMPMSITKMPKRMHNTDNGCPEEILPLYHPAHNSGEMPKLKKSYQSNLADQWVSSNLQQSKSNTRTRALNIRNMSNRKYLGIYQMRSCRNSAGHEIRWNQLEAADRTIGIYLVNEEFTG